MAQKFADIDDYVASLDRDAAAYVSRVRALVHEELPDLSEAIAHNMPTFKRGPESVLHLAGWTEHVSIYPEPEPLPADAGLVLDLAAYSSGRGRGTLKFDLAVPLPEDLVRRVLRAFAPRG